MWAAQDYLDGEKPKHAQAKQGERRLGLRGVLPLHKQRAGDRPAFDGLQKWLRGANWGDVAISKPDFRGESDPHQHQLDQASEVHVGAGVSSHRYSFPRYCSPHRLPKWHPNEAVWPHALPAEEHGKNFLHSALPEPAPQEYLLRILIATFIVLNFRNTTTEQIFIQSFRG